MKHRGSFSISTLILAAVDTAPSGSLTKTALMQRTFINYARLGSYLAELTGLGLLDYESNGRYYRLTSDGREYLRLSHELASYIAPLHEILQRYELSAGQFDSEIQQRLLSDYSRNEKQAA